MELLKMNTLQPIETMQNGNNKAILYFDNATDLCYTVTPYKDDTFLLNKVRDFRSREAADHYMKCFIGGYIIV
jgi:hypothetical protein